VTTTNGTPGTKDRILDAAEKLFSDQGFTGTSLRAITTEANVNLAAVNYHFGTKDGLMEAVFERRLAPLNQERIALLDALEASDENPPLERILEAFVGPPLRLRCDTDRGGPMFMRLLGRTLTEPSQGVHEIFVRQFAEIAARFTPALERALPSLPLDEIFWKMHFAIGTMAHTMCDTFRLKLLSAGRCDAGEDIDATVRRLVSFIAAGLRAPVPTGTRGVEA
jgi:AcrR family transcriptional regulator